MALYRAILYLLIKKLLIKQLCQILMILTNVYTKANLYLLFLIFNIILIILLWVQYEYVITFEVLAERYKATLGGMLSESSLNEHISKSRVALLLSSIVGFIFQNLEIFFFSSFFHFLVKLDGFYINKKDVLRITLLSYFTNLLQLLFKEVSILSFDSYTFKFYENYYPLSIYSILDYNSNFLAFLFQQINLFNILFYVSMGVGLYAITKDKEAIGTGIKFSFSLSMVYTIFIVLVKWQL